MDEGAKLLRDPHPALPRKRERGKKEKAVSQSQAAHPEYRMRPLVLGRF
jgi:hypothetical protein